MSSLTAAVREQLMATDSEYQRLCSEHTRYDSELDQLTSKAYLSEQERLEEVRLKKLKLRVKDQMEQLVRQKQQH